MGTKDFLVTTGAQAAAQRRPAAPRLNPNKLLLSKWTARVPRNREKHFIVTRVFQPDPPATRIDFVEIEAVISRRSFTLPWRDLTDCHRWLQGWS